MNRSSHSELNFRQDVRPSNIKEVQEEKKEEWFKTLLEKNRISFPHFKYSISNKSSQVVVYLVLKTIEIKTEADQLCFSLKKKGISLESTSTKRLPNQLVEASFYYRIVFIVTYKSKVNQATPKYVAITIKSLEPNEFQISKDFNINMHTLIEKYRNVYPDMRCDEKGVPGNWLSHSVELIGTGRLHVEFAFQSADAVNLSTLENLSGCLRHESTPSEGKSISPTDASPLAPTDVPNDSPPITSSQNGDDVARSNTDNRAASGRAPVEYPMSPSFSILSRQEWVPDNQRRKCHHCPKLFVNSIFLIYLQMGFRNDRRHHCRTCGEIFCQQCSSTRISSYDTTKIAFMPRACFWDKINLHIFGVRVCVICYTKSRYQENHENQGEEHEVEENQGIPVAYPRRVLHPCINSNLTPTRPTEGDIFFSLRFGEDQEHQAVMQHARNLRSDLTTKYGLDVVLLDNLVNCDNISKAVSNGLSKAKLVVIFGTVDYGKETSVNFSTDGELQLALDDKVPLYLIKMCDNFEDASTRMRLPSSLLHIKWMPNEPRPLDIVDKIYAKFKTLPNRVLKI